MNFRIGRKPTFILCGVGASIGVFKILLKDYYPYIFLELMESIMSSGLYTVGVILCKGNSYYMCRM